LWVLWLAGQLEFGVLKDDNLFFKGNLAIRVVLCSWAAHKNHGPTLKSGFDVKNEIFTFLNGSASEWIQQLEPNLLGLARKIRTNRMMQQLEPDLLGPVQKAITNGITEEESKQESVAIQMDLHPSSK
jgi:hypothetical protein